ncbi:MAG: replication-associated recombination protein A, partial [Planctomycetes bacterium]|nr:replication-associated recombination protein A [Planctomycetota bacterium]
AVIYVACAPKSNASAMAIWTASKDVREGRTVPVPKHLRDSHYRGAGRMGYGDGYKYAHDYQGGFVEQDYLGVDKTYYTPTDRGHEAVMRAYLASLAGQAASRSRARPDGPKNDPPNAIGNSDSR